MTKPRKAIVSLDATPYYHCVSRCVRRAFLCGNGNNGACYEHRRQWIEDKINALAAIFSIDVCAYAVMSNHYHVVLHIDKATAESWSADEVIRRWHQLYKGTALTQRYVRNKAAMLQAEIDAVDDRVKEWRLRLTNIGWFMRNINEPTARQANQEDGCTGRFWEGRYKSQALLDEQALISCMAYVDLNPIRAGMNKTPEGSLHTSIRRRCQQAKAAFSPNHRQQQVKELMPMIGNPRSSMPKGIAIRLTDYLELVDWTGRIIREDKRGAIERQLPPILDRLQLDPKHWLYLSQHFESRFKRLVGTAYALKRGAEALGYRRTPQSCIQLLE
ncbi:hypothetical protein SIN8267_01283 [Sinobacterium norvegicum]|uniref:Transposase IS200-like domain-containing protein n=1 Tax=Sinobacterium norvegicum TaxID=1641715 RepID=A0ABM9ADB2_9GAMM|nr:transposase [Sinobacterium norvegicum]CAH0991181.1 hypothetical protein SIN8267_01283 [Sinobacterium norvegicum]